MLTLAGVALGGLGFAGTSDRANAASEESFTILAGTDHETTGHVRTADADGPTVMVVGGIHGNEVAGYEAAANVTGMDFERGRLLTVPRANVVAIENGSRTGEDGVDLNRQFPVGSDPTTELARALWDVVTRYDPDVVIDLHESLSLYEGDVTDGVGQAIFHSYDASAEADAEEAADYLNQNYVNDSMFDFTAAPFAAEGDSRGLFVHKVARDTDAVAFLAETVSSGPELATRIEWHTRLVRSLVDEELFGEGGDEVTNESPVAVIETDPADAAERDFSKGDTVVLDASSSSDPDGEIMTYEWDFDRAGDFDEDGETVEVTLSFCGDLPVKLRVTDDEGATATEDIVLSTD